MPISLCLCRMAATLGVVCLTLPLPMGLVDMYIIQRPLLGAGRGVYVGPMVFKSQVDANTCVRGLVGWGVLGGVWAWLQGPISPCSLRISTWFEHSWNCVVL